MIFEEERKMTEKKAKLKIVDELKSTTSLAPSNGPSENSTATPSAAPDDIEELFDDPKLGDGISDAHWRSVPLGKPRNYFRVHPDPKYRRRAEIYVHKIEGEIGEEYYLLGPKMRGKLEEAQPCTVVTCIYRDGTPRLWALKHPREDERDNAAWVTCRKAAKDAIKKWIKLIWVGGSFMTRDAKPGYAPEPDWSKLPSFNELVKIALGEHGIMRNENHPIYRDLIGAAPISEEEPEADDADDI
jgi:hypothetical protein